MLFDVIQLSLKEYAIIHIKYQTLNMNNNSEIQQLMQVLHIQKGIPLDLTQIIMRYAYQPQSVALTNDYKNYIEELARVRTIYNNRWFQIEPLESENWLLNDITRFANASRPTNLGAHYKMRNILNRFYMQRLTNSKDICSQYIRRCSDVSVTNRINVFWGLFTIEERTNFINEYGAVWDLLPAVPVGI